MKLQRKRLTELAVFLDGVDPARFDMTTWWRRRYDNDKKGHPCKSEACALGWGCAIPRFKKLGLHLTHGRDAHPRYGQALGMRAAEKFFGLTCNEARFIFGCSYLNPKNNTIGNVINRIQVVLEQTHDRM